MRKPQPSYYVVMCQMRVGLEATVDPEITRRQVIARIVKGDYTDIEFIHHIEDGFVDDVTSELIDAAEVELGATAIRRVVERLTEADHHRRFES